MTDDARHCVETIAGLVARGEPDRRSVLQIGYNLGRLAELAGGGRAATWDRWKGPVADWDLDALARLAAGLADDAGDGGA